MKNKNLYLIIFILVLFLLIFTLLSYLHGSHDVTASVLQTLAILFVVWVFHRLIGLTLWHTYEKKLGHPPPHLVITIQNLFLLLLTTLFITGEIFEASLTSIITASGLVVATIAFALQGIVYDWFAGIVLDLERPYAIGDWLKINDHIEGTVQKIEWRHTVILTSDNQLIFIPNSQFLKEPFENYSRPEKFVWQTIEISIEHEMPVKRAQRIMRTALLALEDIHEHLCEVYAYQAIEGGVIYHVRYGLKEYEQWRLVQHRVIEAITTALHDHDMKISETNSEYILSRGRSPLNLRKDPIPLEILEKVGFFKMLSKENLELLAKKSIQKLYGAGEVIVKQGEYTTSLFVIAEGTAEVVLNHENEEKRERVSFLGEKDVFGEQALLLGKPRSATVMAKTDTLVFEIEKSIFEEFFKKDKKLVDVFSAIMLERQEYLMILQKRHKTASKEDLVQHVAKEIEALFGL